MKQIYSTVDHLNDKYYNGKLLTLSEYKNLLFDYEDTRAELNLNKRDLVNMIPSIWHPRDILKSKYEKYTEALEDSPWSLVYIYLYRELLSDPIKIGNQEFINPIAYIGKGTPQRIVAHAKSKVSPNVDSQLTKYILQAELAKEDVYVIVASKGLTEDLAKYLEADLMHCYKHITDYYTGQHPSQTYRRFFNIRIEKPGDAQRFFFHRDGTFKIPE